MSESQMTRSTKIESSKLSGLIEKKERKQNPFSLRLLLGFMKNDTNILKSMGPLGPYFYLVAFWAHWT